MRREAHESSWRTITRGALCAVAALVLGAVSADAAFAQQMPPLDAPAWFDEGAAFVETLEPSQSCDPVPLGQYGYEAYAGCTAEATHRGLIVGARCTGYRSVPPGLDRAEFWCSISFSPPGPTPNWVAGRCTRAMPGPYFSGDPNDAWAGTTFKTPYPYTPTAYDTLGDCVDAAVRAYEEPDCDDGSSNDFDGIADWPLDPGCSSADDDSELGSAACDNGVDDDGDGHTDWPSDDGCTSPTDDRERETECEDGSSNDFDGIADWPLDPGCSSEDDLSEYGDAECDDGRDNDFDGRIDWPADTTCQSAGDADEGDPDSDADGVPDAKDNCLVVRNADQHDSDHNGVGDACTPVRARDDGIAYVDYESGTRAPGTTVNVLANDGAGGLVIDGIGASIGTATAPGFGRDGRISFAPPSTGFVGAVEIPYTVRFALDRVGTSRDGASLRLVYRSCRTHSFELSGVNTGRKHMVDARGELRVCTDGTRVTSRVTAHTTGRTWRMRAHEVFAKGVVAKALTALTRGVVGYNIDYGWKKVSKPGASSLSARFTTCEQWSIGPRFKVSRREGERLTKRLRRIVRAKVVERLLRRKLSPLCDISVGYTAGPVKGSSAGYEIPIRVTREWSAGIPLAQLTVDDRTYPVPAGRWHLACPYVRDAIAVQSVRLGSCRFGANR